ncbi:MAG: helix-turn-helix domain-containing protein, partial [Blastocatellia bacterium]
LRATWNIARTLPASAAIKHAESGKAAGSEAERLMVKTVRIVIESGYTIELREQSLREALCVPASDFSLWYVLASADHPAMTGTLALFNPQSREDISWPDGNAELLFVRLAPATLIETASRLRVYPAGSQLLFRQPWQLTAGPRLQQTLTSLAAELRLPATGWREMAGTHIQQLAVHLLRHHINVSRSGSLELSRAGLVDRRLRRAVEFMHDHCGRELSLGQIAEAAGLSEFHFARLFKKLTGVTPHTHLATIRLERARRLLAETDLAISEIAAQVGYASQSHFTRLFRVATGLTPNAFRDATRAVS